jgi:hypothetical protein
MKVEPAFKPALAAGLLLSCSLAMAAPDDAAAGRENYVTQQETAAGWALLFDGKTLKGWHSFKKTEAPKHGWVIEEGWLKCVANAHGGDLVSDREFDDFELSWEWRIPPKANNGVKYLISESRAQPIGHEYQMIDDATVKDPKYATASFYDVLPPSTQNALKPPGEINHSRVLVRGNHVEHWLNGAKVLEYELGSETIKAAVAKSKFKKVEGFGTKMKGHILLTEHHDEAFFRNIKIRVLKEK